VSYRRSPDRAPAGDDTGFRGPDDGQDRRPADAPASPMPCSTSASARPAPVSWRVLLSPVGAADL